MAQNRRQIKRQIKWLGFVISGALAVLCATVLLSPVSGLPGTQVIGLDKAVHFVLFFGLVVPALSFAPRAWVWVVPLAIGYGILIEIIQPYFGRGRELGDMVANSLGAVAAVPVSRWVYQRWLKAWQTP